MPHPRRALALLAALSPLLILLLALTWTVSPAAPAQAANDYVVGDGVHPDSCNMTALGHPMNIFADASITFKCGGPATIVITQSGGLNVLSGRSFTINGGDAITITGIDAYRLFYVQANSALTLTHMVLTHGSDTLGGAIQKDNGTALALDHVTLSDNQSVNQGGAVNDAGGSLRVTNSLFDNNRASDGAAIFSRGSLSVSNTSFRNNVASLTGGALYVLGSASISGGQLLSNTAVEQGGGLDVNPTAIVNVDRVVFDHNHTLTTTVSLLYNGGAIHTSGALTVTNSSFTHNASVYGGALFNYSGPLYLSNDALSGNAAVANGGALSNFAGGIVFIHDSTLTLNAAANGGALHNNYASSNLQLFHTAVLQNSAAVLGGGVYVEDGIFSTAQQSSLSGNIAQAGGALYSHSGGHPILVDSSVEANMATNANGGGLYLEPGSVGGVHNTLLRGNSATGTGGAIDNESANFALFGDTLVGNSAPNGGGLYNAGSNVSLDGDLFQGNSAVLYGGALFNTNTAVGLGTSTIRGNSAFFGGGVFNDTGADLRVYNSTISGNSAQDGGGVLNAMTATLTLQDSTLSGNTALLSGGGLHTSGPVVLIEATISNDGSPSGGALLIDSGASVVLTDTLLAYSSNGGNCIGPIAQAVFSTSSDNTCGLTGFSSGHNHDGLDPLLTGLGNYGGPTLVHMLKHNSPVLNSVIGNGPFNLDQRGQPRPGATSGWDPGAVERQLTDSDLAPWLFLPLARR